MDNTFFSGQKDDMGKENSLQNLEDNGDISGDNGMDYYELKLKKLGRRVNPRHALVLNFKRLQAGKSLIRGSFLQNFFGIGNKIPRHVVTLDEKYLRRCLELIHINVAKATQCNIFVNLSSVKMGILSDGLSSAKIRDEDTFDLGRFVFDCPLAVGTGGVVIRPAEQWVVGSIMGSRSMANILKSPLLQKLGALDAEPSLNDVKGSISYDFKSSPGGITNYSSHKLGSETPILDTRKYGYETVQKRLVSVSSTSSTCSDQSSSNSTPIYQGMLQCTWKGGIPYFVFSLDNQREVYVANLSKERSARCKGLDYLYLFHSSKGNHKEHGISDNDSHLVGKMKVSTSFSIFPQDSKVMETEFVLFSGNETLSRELQTPRHNHRKNKSLPKKMVEVFKSSHSSKQGKMSGFRRSSSIMEDSSWDPCQDKVNNSDGLEGTNLLEEQLPPNLELTAIVVRDHFPENPRPEVGGWGLKFLRKAEVKQTVDTLEAPVPSACSRDNSDCSTSMDILVPAGIHGGPRTSNGGPSSLIERWRSGGHCDCGGWDLGCPLTVLKARSSKEGDLPPTDMSEACKLFDFFVQGSEHGSPTLRIANVHDGLYFIHFQSTLSALQSFSIAVAYIHTQSPTLLPKNVPKLRYFSDSLITILYHASEGGGRLVLLPKYSFIWLLQDSLQFRTKSLVPPWGMMWAQLLEVYHSAKVRKNLTHCQGLDPLHWMCLYYSPLHGASLLVVGPGRSFSGRGVLQLLLRLTKDQARRMVSKSGIFNTADAFNSICLGKWEETAIRLLSQMLFASFVNRQLKTDHLFFGCPFSKQVRSSTALWY